MSYMRFGLMILTSTVVMFILMYVNTYAFEHLFWSETRSYMALVMGATMAVIMLAFMLSMYSNMSINLAIFAGSVLVFGVALWLVRSQATVDGTSYMRAMIPHHSIAIMTSERAQIKDQRVRRLADGIIEAQNREIAQMRYLIADISGGNVVQEIRKDPPARPGTMADAINNTLLSALNPAPMSGQEADQALAEGARCTFRRTRSADPILWVHADKQNAAIKINGIIVPVSLAAGAGQGAMAFGAPGVSLSLRELGDEANWREDAELKFALDQGLEVGYRGFYTC